MTTYTNPFTGQTISPSQVGYESLTLSTSTTLNWPINGTTSSNVAANIIEITATASGILVQMPPATQVSVGQAVIIRNVGTSGNYTFTVTDAQGNTIVSIPVAPTSSTNNTYYIYVTDNTTVAGTWGNIALGTGTSSAQASTLAGYGLTAIGQTLNSAYPVTNLYTSTTLSAAGRASFYVWLSGVGTITLPSSSTVANNWYTVIKNNGTGIVTLTPIGSDTIDGNANQQLQLTESLVIVSNGSTGYNTFAYGRSNSFAYTQLALSLSGLSSPYQYTLSSAQASNTIQNYTGVLNGNTTVFVPATVQLYALSNNTTGSYTLTISTGVSGGSTAVVSQNNTVMLICDGKNVYNANSLAFTTATSITFATGSASSPSINFQGNTTTGIYLPSSNTIGFTSGGTSIGSANSSGWYLTAGILGGAF
jgi:hypothetical protein